MSEAYTPVLRYPSSVFWSAALNTADMITLACVSGRWYATFAGLLFSATCNHASKAAIAEPSGIVWAKPVIR